MDVLKKNECNSQFWNTKSLRLLLVKKNTLWSRNLEICFSYKIRHHCWLLMKVMIRNTSSLEQTITSWSGQKANRSLDHNYSFCNNLLGWISGFWEELKICPAKSFLCCVLCNTLSTSSTSLNFPPQGMGVSRDILLETGLETERNLIGGVGCGKVRVRGHTPRGTKSDYKKWLKNKKVKRSQPNNFGPEAFNMLILGGTSHTYMMGNEIISMNKLLLLYTRLSWLV